MPLPEYQEIQACLPGIGEVAAEAHGTLCGLLCVASGDLPESWIRNTLADAGETSSSAAQDRLTALFETTRAALSGDQMTFMPLLPSEDDELAARAAAIGSWCQGFLYGLAVRGLREFSELPDEIREILEDFAEISRAELGAEEEEEQAESDFVELVEFVRIGVQLIFDELNPPETAGEAEIR